MHLALQAHLEDARVLTAVLCPVGGDGVRETACAMMVDSHVAVGMALDGQRTGVSQDGSAGHMATPQPQDEAQFLAEYQALLRRAGREIQEGARPRTTREATQDAVADDGTRSLQATRACHQSS